MFVFIFIDVSQSIDQCTCRPMASYSIVVTLPFSSMICSVLLVLVVGHLTLFAIGKGDLGRQLRGAVRVLRHNSPRRWFASSTRPIASKAKRVVAPVPSVAAVDSPRHRT